MTKSIMSVYFLSLSPQVVGRLIIPPLYHLSSEKLYSGLEVEVSLVLAKFNLLNIDLNDIHRAPNVDQNVLNLIVGD